MKLAFKKLHPLAVIPRYQTQGSSGFDLVSIEELEISPLKWQLIRTGLAVEIPSGYEIQVRSRSGLALQHGLSVLNSPGTVDSDYRGELKVILMNHSVLPYVVKIGDRIAQAVLCAVYQADCIEVEELSQTQREGGFGSTGR
ncbi:deoxyuridine 5'-triphosphate nucleotidohydrolase [Helicobacter monodelphidis]|uniref:dUTP diphosphatase n=1 Tax=Helicobacter sp. 15-1451 TaxID=2004995 RepID=UPI000DCC1E28|nr:dUTP diphosphatase [Helicobacter sp. 15-1451]RAX58942.1 deoxyuridine 5'-triphosphate nucleotidohydrolase [Helicobacter sp. 15-1451]